MYWNNYKIEVSDRKNKKYYALVNGKKIHFGDKRYQHYYDILGIYNNLNHYDKKRRDNYYNRHGKNAKIGSAKYFSHNILWPLNI